MTKRLYKTTIVIWSEYLTDGVELNDLAREATSGDAYCVSKECTAVEDPTSDPHWDRTEFFGENDKDHSTTKLITVEEAFKMLQDGNLPDEYELTYKCPENVVEDITEEGELDYRIFYRRNVDDDPVYGGGLHDDDEDADTLCITLTVPATPVECPQCEKVFTDPANADAIGDHALCTACLAAWRVTAAMLNYEPGGGAGDGYSEEPPFLPIPEWWAARGLEVPEVEFYPANMSEKWKEELPPTAIRDLGDILAELAYDEAFKKAESSRLDMEIRLLDADETEPQPTLLVNVFSDDDDKYTSHEFTMVVGCGKAHEHRNNYDRDIAKAFEEDWESALEHLRITDPVEWNVGDVIKIMREEFNWLIDSEKYPVAEVAY